MRNMPPTPLMVFLTFSMLFVWNADKACAQKMPSVLQQFLKNNIGLSQKDINKCNRDVVVTQVAMHDEPREIAVFAIVRMDVPQDVFISRFRKIDRFMKNDKLHQIGILSDPPKTEDLSTLQLPESDFEEMARCRIGYCKVKFPAETLQRLQEIDWSAQDAADSAMELFRTRCVDYVRAYTEKGNATLMVYADKEKPITLTEGFESLLSQGAYLYRSDPELMSYLKDFFRPPPQGVEDFFFWSLEDFGQRPTFTINQAAIYEKGEEENATHMIAVKQIYASHYFQARLQIMDLVTTAPESKGPSFYLLYLDRLRFDMEVNTVKRMLISKGLRSHVTSWLGLLRNTLQDNKAN
jgi:hypothetical protein